VSRSEREAGAGDIRVAFRSKLSMDHSKVLTSANAGPGSDIRAIGCRRLDLADSEVKSSVTRGKGDGCDINVQTDRLLMRTGLIAANAASGNGGGQARRLDVETLLASGNTINRRNVA
jgi:hypothetical protein